MSTFPLDLGNKNLDVATLPGAAKVLDEDGVLKMAAFVCDRLRIAHEREEPYLSVFIHCENDIVGTVVQDGDIYTLYLGLGLEVVEAARR